MMMTKKEKRLVPELRFEGFEGEWKEKRLDSISKYIKSGRSKGADDGLYNLYGSTGVIGKTNDNIEEGSYLLVARVGAKAGQINCVEGKFGVSDNTLIVSLKEDVSLQFINDFLIRYNLNRLIYGSGQPLVTGTLLKNIKTPFPIPEEQQKIATFLTSIDTRLQHLEKKKTLLEQYKKGVMQKIFSQEIRFRDQDGKEFEEWQRRRLGEVFKSISTRPYQIKSKDFNPSGKYRIVDQGKDLIAGYSDSVDNVFNDLPIVVFGDHTTIIKFIDFDFIVGADGTKLLKNKRNDNLKYLFYNLSYNNVPQEGYKRHYSMLSEVSLQIPCLAEQTKIAHFLSALDRKIAVTNEQIEQTKKWKKGLLQRMFV